MRNIVIRKKEIINKNKFSEETMQSLIELGEVLRDIRVRLVAEGKAKIVNGRVIFLDNKQKDDTTSRVQRQSRGYSKKTYRGTDTQTTRADG